MNDSITARKLREMREMREAAGDTDRFGFLKADLARFSMSRAALGMASGSLVGLEGEMHSEIARQTGHVPGPHQAFVPMNLVLRDMTVAGASGSNFLASGTGQATIFDLFRARSVVAGMGATLLENLSESQSIPRVTADGATTWLTNESTALTEGQPVIGQFALTPKHVGAYTEISRLLKVQSPAVDSLLTSVLVGSIAAAVDAAALAGTGASGQPLGIHGTAGVGSFSGTSLAWAGLVESQLDVLAGREIDVRSCGYVAPAATAQLLMNRQKFTGTDSTLWGGTLGDGVVAGTRAIATSAAPTASLTFGHWPSLVFGTFGFLTVEVNPYANFQAGVVGMRGLLACDIAVRNPGDFSVATSIT